MANYSPLSSENHRSLFVEPAKRGKQGAGGEALFAFYINDIYIITPHVYSCFLAALSVDCQLKQVKERDVFRELLFCFLMNYV